MPDQIEVLHNSGRKILSIFWPDDSEFTVGEYGTKSMVAVPVAGQGAYVWWIKREFELTGVKETTLINPAHLAMITYEGESDD